jgi:hypothetical protein
VTDGPPFALLRSGDVDAIVDEAARRAARVLDERCAAGLPHTAAHSMTLYFASLMLIDRIMGDGWVRAHLDKKHQGFLGPPTKSAGAEGTFNDWYRKVLRFADTLLAVHDLEHVGDRLRRLKGAEVESGIAELAVVEILRLLVPTFLRPEGPGHDVEVMLDADLTCAVEIKCRLQQTDNTVSRIVDKLKDARKQLPRNRPSLIWMRHDERVGVWPDGDLVEAAIRQFFRNTQAVSAVVYSFERDLMDHLPSGKPFTVAVGLGMRLNEANSQLEPLRRLKRRLEGDYSEREMALVDPVRRRLSATGEGPVGRASPLSGCA